MLQTQLQKQESLKQSSGKHQFIYLGVFSSPKEVAILFLLYCDWAIQQL